VSTHLKTLAGQSDDRLLPETTDGEKESGVNTLAENASSFSSTLNFTVDANTHLRKQHATLLHDGFMYANNALTRQEVTDALHHFDNSTKPKGELSNGDRLFLDVLPDELKCIVSKTQMQMMKFAPIECDNTVPLVAAVQIIESFAGQRPQLPHLDNMAGNLAMGVLLQGKDLTGMCPIKYVNIAKPSASLLAKHGFKTLEEWENALHDNYVIFSGQLENASWSFASYSVKEREVFKAMLQEMGVCVESKSKKGEFTFLSSEELYGTHDRCVPKGSSKAGDAIIFRTNMLHYGPEIGSDDDRRVIMYVLFETKEGAVANSVRRKLESVALPIYYEQLVQKVKLSDKAERLLCLEIGRDKLSATQLKSYRANAKIKLMTGLTGISPDSDTHSMRKVEPSGFALFHVFVEHILLMSHSYSNVSPELPLHAIIQDKWKPYWRDILLDMGEAHLAVKENVCHLLESYWLCGMVPLEGEELAFSNYIGTLFGNGLTLQDKVTIL